MIGRGIAMAAALTGLALAGPASGQAAKPFVPEFNTVGSPVLPADKLVPASALGHMEPFRGRPWWQVLTVCTGAWENEADAAETAGDKSRAEALRTEAQRRFYRPALARLVDDRHIDAAAAADVLRPDVNFQFLAAGDNPRPFAESQARCRVVEAAHAAVGRPLPAPAVAAPAPAAPFERRFKAAANLTRRYDGEPAWQLMVRCAKGSQGVAGPRGQLAGQFAVLARGLLNRDGGVSMVDGEARVMAALPAAEAIAPGTSEADDACIAMARQLAAEVQAGG